MHREEWEQGTLCAECGAEIDPSRDPVYTYADDSGSDYALCSVCASRRGGVYDLELERWAILPDLKGLFASQRPHP
jgi:DNA-directed RNA polymerase subunit RPC12/RpoP